ncbi:MAG: RNA polymerase sporulation sigma factor SigK [Ruminococcaceae bacterium]|nr:RNA polymerase sporulation sigma factor SigK [Oscillospiraceae bacterium]
MLELLQNLFAELLFLVGYISNANSFPKPLSAEEEQKYLAQYAQGDRTARSKLIEHNLRLVAHISKKYSNENNAEDLISIGTIGLIKGINTFNHEKNSRLVTYIARCIENEILMHLRADKKTGNEISMEECIGTDKEGNNMTFSDILPTDEDDIADILSAKFDAQVLYQVMGKVLKKSEYDILCWRYGLLNCRRKTQKEVADILGISRSYVSRIEKKALSKLYEVLKDMDIQ